MLILDDLLVGGLRFVLDKVVQAVDAEMKDDSGLKEELLATQMQLELGEISEEEFAEREHELLARIREVRERQRGQRAPQAAMTFTGVEGVEATFTGDEPAGEGPKR